MEIYFDIIYSGHISIALALYEDHGFSVIFTATDAEGRRILKAPVMEHGQIKIYLTADEAIRDAVRKLAPSAVRKPR